MAATVTQRTVYVEQTKDGYFRFADWALTQTSLGMMAEPYFGGSAGLGDNGIAYDATDVLALITNIEQVNSDMLPTMLSGGGPACIGGPLMPRTGR